MKQKIILICCIIGWLSACGQSGRLYLPKQTDSMTTTSLVHIDRHTVG
ncbi:MAG TPA: lipoprotein [Gammaproteobacteria bacterium]|nr:lipoprotein [Gammaproteobacteria bacterium]